MTGDASAVVLRNGPVDYIIVTNRDHVREAVKYQDEFHCQLHVPELDAPQMDLKPTKTFKDGELLVGGIWVIQLKDQKSPGESALFIQQRQGVLILGDALIGKPAGALSMLPEVCGSGEGQRRIAAFAEVSIRFGVGRRWCLDRGRGEVHCGAGVAVTESSMPLRNGLSEELNRQGNSISRAASIRKPTPATPGAGM